MRPILSSRRLLGIIVSVALRHAVGLLAGFVLLAGLSSLAPVLAATLPSGFTESLFASGLTNPTAMAFAPDGRLFVCEQGGQLRVIKNGALLAGPFLTVTVDSSGERGLLGITFDPNFASNQFVYVYYTATTPATHNRVSRFTANGDVAIPGSEVIIFDLNNLSGATNHNGGAIHFGPDGQLYIAAGENANPANSQTLANLLGKILRINADGSIPTDNPFFLSAAGNNRAIWALGLRNPYTFAFQSGTGRMFINDVGQNIWEEIDDGIAGSNYGWSICEGLCSPPNASFRDPLFQYGHGSSSTTGCAITGGAFYNPTTTQFPSDYVGKYFFAEFCTGWIRRFDPATSTAIDFASGISSPVDLLVSDDGLLYYLARGSGSVFRVQFTGPTAADGVVSGRITTSDGTPVEGAVVRLSGTQTRKTIADADGNYHFDNVETNGFYTVTPARANYGFSPANRSFTQLGNHTEAAFAASATAETANPLDTAEYLVRQQYLDFLGREPDEGGFNYWSDRISECGSDTACMNARRRDVAAAFFVSNEFQNSGYFVYRLYKGAFAERPTFAQYLPDRNSVIGGPNLESSRAALADDFVQRGEFKQAYPDSLTSEQFVNKLFDTAALFPYTVQRQIEIDKLNNNATRSQVLQDLIDYAQFKSAEYNSAFVLTEYFGYLRRNPDQGGYDFWLNVLNTREPGNYRGMVCSFITSTEYQRRFGSIVSHGNAECGP